MPSKKKANQSSNDEEAKLNKKAIDLANKWNGLRGQPKKLSQNRRTYVLVLKKILEIRNDSWTDQAPFSMRAKAC